MTIIYAQDFIASIYQRMGLPMPTIEAVEDQPNRYRLLPDVPYSSEDMAIITRNFGDVAPTEFGVEVGISDTYPPKPAAAPTAAERAWLTPENTLQRRLEQVLIEHGLIDNVKAITDIVGSYVVKFNGATPAVPAGTKRADLAQAGLLEIKTGSPGTWVIRISDMWRIEQQAGDLLRQLRAEVADLTRRNDDLKEEVSAAQDRIAEKDARIEKYRAERDQFHSDVIALEAQLLDAVAIIPAQPAAQMMMYSTALSGDRETMIDLPELLGQGWHIAAEWIVSGDADKYYARLEKRPVSRLMVQPTERAARRPYMVNRNARMQADNAEVVRGIHAVKSSPRPAYRPLIGVNNG